MAWDEFTEEYHLTPEGWREGTFKASGSPKSVEPPPGRVLTMRKRQRDASPYSPPDVEWTEIWRSTEVTENSIQTLLEMFGNVPGKANSEQPPQPRLKPLNEILKKQ